LVAANTEICSDQPSADVASSKPLLRRSHSGSSHCNQISIFPLGGVFASGALTVIELSGGGVVGNSTLLDSLSAAGLDDASVVVVVDDDDAPPPPQEARQSAKAATNEAQSRHMNLLISFSSVVPRHWIHELRCLPIRSN
jgi:hypothetical protein